MAYSMAYLKTRIPSLDRRRKIKDLAFTHVNYLFLLYIFRFYKFLK